MNRCQQLDLMERLHLLNASLKIVYFELTPPQDIFSVFREPPAFAALASLTKEYALSIKDQIDVIVGLGKERQRGV